MAEIRSQIDNYTRTRFFISFRTIWRNKYRNEAMIDQYDRIIRRRAIAARPWNVAVLRASIAGRLTDDAAPAEQISICRLTGTAAFFNAASHAMR